MEFASLEVVYPVIEDAIIAALSLKKPREDDAIPDLRPAIGTSTQSKPASSSALSEDEGIFMSRSSMASSSAGSSPNSRHSYTSSSNASAGEGDFSGRAKVWSSVTKNWTFSSFLSDHPSGRGSQTSSLSVRGRASAAANERRLSTGEAYYQYGPVGAAPIRRLVLVKEADRSDNRNSNNNDDDIGYDVSPPRTPRGLVDVDARSPCCEQELCILDKVGSIMRSAVGKSHIAIRTFHFSIYCSQLTFHFSMYCSQFLFSPCVGCWVHSFK